MNDTIFEEARNALSKLEWVAGHGDWDEFDKLKAVIHKALTQPEVMNTFQNPKPEDFRVITSSPTGQTGNAGVEKSGVYTAAQLRGMLEDVVNELELSDKMIEKHGPLGTPPAQMVREVLEQKNLQITMLQRGFVDVGAGERVRRDDVLAALRAKKGSR